MSMPEYYSDNEHANNYLRLMLALLGKHKIPANLINITLCYEYVTGNADIQQAMEIIFDKPTMYTEEKAIALFKEYIWDEEKQTHEKLNKILNKHFSEALNNVNTINSKANHSSSRLEQKAIQLESEPSVEKTKALVNTFISESKNMVNISQSFEEELNNQKAELEQLKTELETTKNLAETDPLTKLKNRRVLSKALEENISSINNQKLCLMMLDIDFFKKVNDKYGHLVGDKVICFISQILTENIKNNEIAARIGGEEFAILLPSTKLSTAIAQAEIIRKSIEKSSLSISKTHEKLDPVTISIGVTVYKPGDTSEAFIDRADKALYSAKNSGRNRVNSIPKHF
jgi:diguanylate cyclase